MSLHDIAQRIPDTIGIAMVISSFVVVGLIARAAIKSQKEGDR